MDEWWKIEGVPKPVYINIASESRFWDIIVLLLLLSIIISGVTGILPGCTSILATTLLLLVELFLRSSWNIRQRRKDIMYIREILMNISEILVKWSIPHSNIPVVAVTNTGVYIIVFYIGDRIRVLIFKPIVYYRVVNGKPIVKLKLVMKNKKKINNTNMELSILDIIFPHPEIKGMNYHIRGKTIIIKHHIHPRMINTLIKNSMNTL